MNRFFNILYEFRFQHQFYTDLDSSDFKISPMEITKNWMRMNGMILRTDETGFSIGYGQKAEFDTDPVVEIDASKILPFAIELRNSSILNLTDLPPKTDVTDLYICRGSYADAALLLTTISTRQPQFTEEYSYSLEAITFRLEDIEGNKVYQESLAGLEDPLNPTLYNYSFSVNISSGFEQGRYKLKTFNNGIMQDELEVYIYNQYDFKNLFAISELELDTSINYNILPYESILSFDAFSNLWTYKIELTRSFTLANLSLTDETTGSLVTFSMDPLVPAFVEGETITFTSSDVFQKTELPFTKLQLKLSSAEANFVLDELPNPSHENQNSIVYLKI